MGVDNLLQMVCGNIRTQQQMVALWNVEQRILAHTGTFHQRDQLMTNFTFLQFCLTAYKMFLEAENETLCKGNSGASSPDGQISTCFFLGGYPNSSTCASFKGTPTATFMIVMMPRHHGNDQDLDRIRPKLGRHFIFNYVIQVFNHIFFYFIASYSMAIKSVLVKTVH